MGIAVKAKSVYLSLKSTLFKTLEPLSGKSNDYKLLISKKVDQTFSSRESKITFFKRFSAILISVIIAIYFLFYVLLNPDTYAKDHYPAWMLKHSHPVNKPALLQSLNYNETIKEVVLNGSVYHLSEKQVDQHWRKPYLFNDPFSMNQVPLDNDRCPIYTYFPHATNASKELSEEQKESRKYEYMILETWAKSMWSLGLQPVILDETDAKNHPQYKSFQESNVLSPQNKADNLKWLAWLSRGAGIFSDYRVIPVTSNAEDEAIQYLKACQFKERLAFDDSTLSLIVSDIKDTKPFLFDIMRGYPEKDLLLNFEVFHQNAFAYYSNRNFRAVTNQIKGGSQASKNAANDKEIDPKKILHMMQSHLHQTFLDGHTDGVVFSLSSYMTFTEPWDLIHGIAGCPSTGYFDNCAPTSSALHNLAYVKGGKHRKALKEACEPRPCSSRYHKRYTVSHRNFGLPDPYTSNYFTLGIFVHPWSMSSMFTHDNVSLDDVRSLYQRNLGVKTMTNPIMGSEIASMDLRLMVLKDSMIQNSRISNISWIYPEQNVDDVFETLQWDIGFNLSNIYNDGQYKPSFESMKHSFITRYRKGQYEQIVADIHNDLVESDYREVPVGDRVYEKNDVFQSLKKWTPADFEAWMTLRKWALVKKASRQSVVDQLLKYREKIYV